MGETIIKIKNGVIRQQKNTILKEVNVEIRQGEFVYLIGKVGSGKSSFLKTLYAELPLEFGEAEVAGFQLKKLRKSQVPLLRRKCGIVFQDFRLLIDRNVYQNLEFVLRATGWRDRKAIRERIETVLEKVGMPDKKEKMPHQLSGGEQQRVVLARALLNAPPIILADEPTGNIDPETSYQLVELLKDICATGKTVIIATHQYDLIERFPGRVFCCEEGRLVEKNGTGRQPAGQADTPESGQAGACTDGQAETTPGGQAQAPTGAREGQPEGEEPEEEICGMVEMVGPDTPEAAETTAPVPTETTTPEKLGTTTSAEPETTPPLSAVAGMPATPRAPQPTKQVIEEAEQQVEAEMEREQTEEDIMALIGKLEYPEMTAFDYELEEQALLHNVALPGERPPEEQEKEEEEQNKEEQDTLQKKTPPVMDLDLMN